jgi:hypothetical protein
MKTAISRCDISPKWSFQFCPDPFHISYCESTCAPSDDSKRALRCVTRDTPMFKQQRERWMGADDRPEFEVATGPHQFDNANRARWPFLSLRKHFRARHGGVKTESGWTSY